MTLDERIRQAVAAGELTHFAIAPTKGGFVARYTPASGQESFDAFNADPIKAALAALEAKPKRRKANSDFDFG